LVRPHLCSFLSESFWDKHLGELPPSSISLNKPGGYHHVRVSWNVRLAYLNTFCWGFSGPARQQCGFQPESLIDEVVNVRYRLDLLVRPLAITTRHGSVEETLEFGLLLGVFGEVEQRRSKGCGSGLTRLCQSCNYDSLR
jgi:hypothetical protein